MLQQRIKSARLGIGAISVRFFMSNDTYRRKTMFAFLSWILLINKLFKDAAERYANNVSQPHYSENLYIESVRTEVPSVTLCNKLGRGNSSRLLINGGAEKI